MDTNKATFAFCTAEDVGITPKSAEAGPLIASLDEYFSVFAKPSFSHPENPRADEMVCLSCGSRLSGIIGSFTYGIQHGEGYCGECKWPGRRDHYPKDSEGDIFDGSFLFILQYHPDLVTNKPNGDN